MRILIVGIDSLLGSAVASHLKHNGHVVIGTSRRGGSGHIHFDLEIDKENWPVLPTNIDAAFIAAAITDQTVCSGNTSRAWRVNVEQTIALIERLKNNDIHVVYPSSNLVLPCTTPCQPVDLPLSPIGYYGETKAAIERYSGPAANISIARLPKILSDEKGILESWRDKIEREEKIKAYSNLIISPVSLAYAAHFICALLEKRIGGLWQISGSQEVSYFDVAQHFIHLLKPNVDLPAFLESDLAEAGAFALPAHPSLDCSLTLSKLGIGSQSLADMLKDCLS